MDADTFVRLLAHRGHDVDITTYGASDENLTLECLDCGEVILTQDLEGELLEQYAGALVDKLLETW